MKLLLGGGLGSSMITGGILLILFGLAILAAPELLAYIVATVLVLSGVSALFAGMTMRKARKDMQRMFINMK
jgi:uncharacterized membrane protein HdeD (DUF308 family)